MGGILFVLLAIIILLIFYVIYFYNSLVGMRMHVREAWSQIDVQLKRRADLIPNLVETVKGYAKHEKSVFENVTKARSALMSATGPVDKAKANNQLADALKSLFAVAENYPNLRASENFVQLQKELSDTEDKISYARQFYNSAVSDYNTRIQVFPGNIIASNFHFEEKEFFETDEQEKASVKVKFD